MLSVKINAALAERARLVLERDGLTPDDAVRAMFAHIAEHGSLPDCLKVPNQTTRSALADADRVLAKRSKVPADR